MRSRRPCSSSSSPIHRPTFGTRLF
jgi:hypothetical protein